MLQQELLSHWQEQVVALGIEVGGVSALAALEIDFAELLAGDEDIAATGGIEHGYAIAAAHLEHGIDHLLARTADEVLTTPRCEEEQLSMGIALNESQTEDAET